MSLPRFTKDQQKFVVANLIVMTPHSEIARKFQRLFPYFVPQDMDQAAYEEAFIKRAKDYVSNKRRKWHRQILNGRVKERRFRRQLGSLSVRRTPEEPLPHRAEDVLDSISLSLSQRSIL